MKTYKEFMSEAPKGPFVSRSVKKISSLLPKPKQLNIKMPTAGSLVPSSLRHKNIMSLSKEASSKLKSKAKAIAKKPFVRIKKQITNAAKKTGASIGSSIAKKIGL